MLEQALTRRKWLVIHLDALSSFRRWEDILPVLDQKPAALETAVIELYRSRCHEELGDLPAAREHWRRGLLQASGNPHLLLYFATYAEKLGKRQEARHAYEAMTRVREAAPFAREQLARLDLN